MLVHVSIQGFELGNCRIVTIVVDIADAEVVFKILMLEVPQVEHRARWLVQYGSHVVLLVVALVDYYCALQALGESLQLQMATPLPILTHVLHILVDCALFVLVDEVPEKLLVVQHVLAGLLS